MRPWHPAPRVHRAGYSGATLRVVGRGAERERSFRACESVRERTVSSRVAMRSSSTGSSASFSCACARNWCHRFWPRGTIRATAWIFSRASLKSSKSLIVRTHTKVVFSFASRGCLNECAVFPSLATAKHRRWHQWDLGHICDVPGTHERLTGAGHTAIGGTTTLRGNARGGGYQI